MYGHIIPFEPSGNLSRNPLAPFLATQLALQLGLAEALVSLYYPLPLIPFPARDLTPLYGLWQGVISRYQIGPNWALVIPLFNPGRPYPNLPL